MYGWIKSKSLKGSFHYFSCPFGATPFENFLKNFDSFEVNSAFSSR